MAGSPPWPQPTAFDRRMLLVPLAVLLLGVVVAWSLAGSGSSEAEAQGASATIPALVGDPQEWIGREVTIVGLVEERYPSRSFSVAHQGTVDEVIVMTRGAAHEAARAKWPRGEVEVTGKVRMLGPDDEEIIGADMPVRRGSPVVVAWDVPVRAAEAP